MGRGLCRCQFGEDDYSHSILTMKFFVKSLRFSRVRIGRKRRDLHNWPDEGGNGGSRHAMLLLNAQLPRGQRTNSSDSQRQR